MINIKNITIRNFMSVGNVTQGVRFDESGLTLVLGNNVDLGGDGSRNGTGKTTLVNALSYGLYGTALTNIRKDNLVNRTNNKGMLVTVEFEKDGIEYRVERGRKPNIFKFMVAGQEANADETDEGQGEGRLTQLEIEKSQLENKYKSLLEEHTNLSKKLEEIQNKEKLEQKKQIEFSEKIDELNQETDTLLEEIDKWQM